MEEASDFLFVAQQRALDFVNTEIMSDGQREDLIAGFPELVDWLKAADLVSDQEMRLIAQSFASEAKREKAILAARDLRSTIRSLAGSLADDRQIVGRDLAALNEALRAAGGYDTILRRSDRYQLQHIADWSTSVGLLAPIARAAAALLTDCDSSLVKRCEGTGCILFFYDTTRNHSRRWCSMEACGNLNKVRAHRDRDRNRYRSKDPGYRGAPEGLW